MMSMELGARIYTIQEGESDLFLINNRNGKKYKFNLTEVISPIMVHTFITGVGNST